ncbi:MAG: hypothetical protein ACK50J_20135, partial [Planctomyces sp.]
TMHVISRDSATGSISQLATEIQETPGTVSELTAIPSSVKLLTKSSVAVRSDRHTLVYARGNAADTVQLTARNSSGERESWQFGKDAVVAAGGELKILCDIAQKSSGLNSSVVGLEGLSTANREFKALMAAQNGNVRLTALKQDSELEAAPVAEDEESQSFGETETPEAESVEGVELTPEPPMSEGQEEMPAEGEDADESSPAPSSENEGISSESSDSGIGTGRAAEFDPLQATEARIAIETQKLTREVDQVIDTARGVSTSQPVYAEGILKDVLSTIRDSSDISADVRAELERRVISALDAVQISAAKVRLIQSQAAQREATVESQRKLLADAALDEDRLKQLIASVAGLLKRARKGDIDSYEDAEQVARKALEMAPGDGTATAAVFVSEAAGQLSKAYDLRN